MPHSSFKRIFFIEAFCNRNIQEHTLITHPLTFIYVKYLYTSFFLYTFAYIIKFIYIIYEKEKYKWKTYHKTLACSSAASTCC